MTVLAEQINRSVEAMLTYVETQTTDQASDILKVPARDYLDPARFEREMALIFKRLPLMLALSIELPKPGDYKAMEVMEVPVLITRDRDGQVHAMLNVCTHRGAPLVKPGQGSASRFSCPYHAWTFHNDGRLLAVSDRAKFGEVDKDCHRLKQLPCQEVAGMIFVILTPGLEIDVTSYLGGMLDDLESLGFANWHFCGNRDIFGANWKIAYDGYLEGYHFAAAHPETVHPRTFSNIMHFEGFGPHLRIGFPQRTIATLRDVPRTEWHRHQNDGYDFVRTLFPNLSIFVAPEIAQIALLLPGPTPGENRTILTYVTPKAPADEADREKMTMMASFFGDVTNQEDYVLGLSIQKGLEAGGLDHVTFGRNERGNQYFHRWVDHYLKDDPASPPPSL